MPGFNFLVSREDWSLHRKGQQDQQRHQEKVKEAIRKNLQDIVSDEGLILAEGDKLIKVPIKSLEEYRFRYDFNRQNHVGQGEGDSKVGDVIASGSINKGSGKGQGAGEEPGTDYYEAEITVDELAELMFDDLGLPNLMPKKQPRQTTTAHQFNDVRKKGLMSNIDKKRTIIEIMKRNAREGKASWEKITPDDLRFKTWEKTIKDEANAVVLAMMDTSASMGDFEKYVARSFFFWMVRFLRTKYTNVEVVFLTHSTEAKEVREEDFFRKGESGGTKCSSVYRKALEIINDRYPPEDYNIYPFHFSDGDNFTADNQLCVELVQQLLPLVSMMGYGQIQRYGFYYNSTLREAFKSVDSPKMVAATIEEKKDVYPALKAFFGKALEDSEFIG